MERKTPTDLRQLWVSSRLYHGTKRSNALSPKYFQIGPLHLEILEWKSMTYTLNGTSGSGDEGYFVPCENINILIDTVGYRKTIYFSNTSTIYAILSSITRCYRKLPKCLYIVFGLAHKTVWKTYYATCLTPSRLGPPITYAGFHKANSFLWLTCHHLRYHLCLVHDVFGGERQSAYPVSHETSWWPHGLVDIEEDGQ